MDDAGNFKGVMLCDRPMDPPRAGVPVSHGKSWMPASGNADRSVGLPPGPRVARPTKEKGKSTVMDKHRRTLHKMQKERAKETAAVKDLEAETEERMKTVAEFGTALRTAILDGKDVSKTWSPVKQAGEVKRVQEEITLERTALGALATSSGAHFSPNSTRRSAVTVGSLDSSPEGADALENSFRRMPKSRVPDDFVAGDLDQEMEDLVSSALAERTAAPAAPAAAAQVLTVTAGKEAVADAAAAPGKAKGGKAKGGLPAWALSSGAAEEVEEEEEEELLSFVDSLDYDNYIDGIDDPDVKIMMQELRKGEGVMSDAEEKAWKKDFVTVLNHLAMKEAKGESLAEKAASLAGLSDGGMSTVSRMTESMRQKMMAASETRSAIAAGEVKKAQDGAWDASTVAGDDTGRFEKVEKSKEAADLLWENPDMKGVHSIASARQLLESAGGKQGDEAQR